MIDMARASAVTARRGSRERRREQRQLTLMRVGLLHTGEGTELCLVRNLSADGLMARVYRRFQPGDNVRVELKTGHLFVGDVAWARGYDVGVQFGAPIDIVDVLSTRWAAESERRPRLPRLELDCPAIARHGAKSFVVRVRDISQGGAKVAFRASLPNAAEIVLSLPDLPSVQGTVRWCRDGEAGLSFNERLPLEVLARWAESRRQTAPLGSAQPHVSFAASG